MTSEFNGFFSKINKILRFLLVSSIERFTVVVTEFFVWGNIAENGEFAIFNERKRNLKDFFSEKKENLSEEIPKRSKRKINSPFCEQPDDGNRFANPNADYLQIWIATVVNEPSDVALVTRIDVRRYRIIWKSLFNYLEKEAFFHYLVGFHKIYLEIFPWSWRYNCVRHFYAVQHDAKPLQGLKFDSLKKLKLELTDNFSSIFTDKLAFLKWLESDHATAFILHIDYLRIQIQMNR